MNNENIRTNQDKTIKTEEINYMKINKETNEKRTENVTVAEENPAITEVVSADNFEKEQAAEQVAAATASSTSRDLNSSEEAVRLTRKTFELCGGASMVVNMYDGSNSVVIPVAGNLGLSIPITVSLVHKRNNDSSLYGGFRLNILEELRKNSDNTYTHIDAVGSNHTLSPAATVNENCLIENGIKKYFQVDGYLNFFENSCGQKVWVDHESNGKITGLHDNKGHNITFVYENERISSINNDTTNEITSFSFNGTGLTVIYPQGGGIKITVNSNGAVTKIESSEEGQSTEITYDANRPKKITQTSLYTSLWHNGAYPVQRVMSTTDISYKANRTDVVLNDEYGTEHIYMFAQDGNLSAYYEIQNSVVSKAIQYSYFMHLQDNVYYAKEDTLRKVALSDFVFVVGDKVEKDLNDQNLAFNVRTEKHIDAETTQSTSTFYSFGDFNRIDSETTFLTTEYSDDISESYTLVKENDYYDDYENDVCPGALKSVTSYVQGEENSTGMTKEEYTYDAHGNMLVACRYNSRDTATKFYTKREYDEMGRVTDEYDETGTHKTHYDYDSHSRVTTVTLPDSTVISYGYDSNGNVTSITQINEGTQTNKMEKGYTKKLLTRAKSGGTSVDYTYDYKRRFQGASANSGENVTMTHTDDVVDGYEQPCANKTLHRETLQYPNGDTETVEYDQWDNVVATKFNGEYMTYTYSDEFGKVTEYIINENGVLNSYTPTYDDSDRLINSGMGETFTYDDHGLLTQRKITSVMYGDPITYNYAYKSNYAKDLDTISVDGVTISPTKDKAGRYTGKQVKRGSTLLAEEQISYRKVGNKSTNMPSVENYRNLSSGMYVNEGVKYFYDARGNITDVTKSDGTLVTGYMYDDLGRLIRENNNALGKTTVFTYDNNGNIKTKTEAAYTTSESVSGTVKTYAYDSTKKDRMTSFNGESCVYNSMGRPTTYRGKTVTWARGKFVSSIGSTTFATDGEGKRIKKDDTFYKYDNEGRISVATNRFYEMAFMYDHTGLFGIKYAVSNGSLSETYYYRKNALGDIIAILDKDGKVVVKYVYDAWGNHKVLDASGNEIASGANHIGNKNPFRYRGYYYDTETGLYYCKARYYDPEVGRFISADDLAYVDHDHVNGTNLYVYCNNNPVMNVDPEGHFVISALVVGFIVGAVIGAAIGGAVAYKVAKDNDVSGWALVGYTIAGIAGGAAIGGLIGAAAAYAAPAISSFMGSSFTIGTSVTAAGELVAISVTGAQIVEGAAIVMGLQILFDKGSGPRFGHNKYENQMWKEAARILGIDDNLKLLERLHRELDKPKYPYNENLRDLVRTLSNIMDNWKKAGKL